MIVWKYKILTNAGPIITKNVEFAEKKSKKGYRIFCIGENNVYKYSNWFFAFIKVKKGPILTTLGDFYVG